MNKRMQEAEVSLRIALHYVKNGKTVEDVEVAIDGAQVKTGKKVHFVRLGIRFDMEGKLVS